MTKTSLTPNEVRQIETALERPAEIVPELVDLLTRKPVWDEH